MRTELRVAKRNGAPLVYLHLVCRVEVGWALASRAAAAGTYFALLFVIAIYLQLGLGKSPLYSGLALVAWVAAFGLGGPLLRRLAPAGRRRAAMLGSAMMACAYFAFAACVIGGFRGDVWLIALLGIGGFGFGLATTALLGHLTSVVSGEAAAEMSGLYNTTSQVAAVAGIACFESLYVGAATDQSQAFAVVCGACNGPS